MTQSIPLATFAVTTGLPEKALREVRQALIQIITAYNCAPNRKEYTAHVVVLYHSIYHFTRTTVSRDYVRCLCEGLPLPEQSFHLWRSPPMDLKGMEERREFVKYIVGLFRRLSDDDLADYPCDYLVG